MTKRMLFIHEFAVIRTIVAGYVQTELTDIEIETAGGREEALRILRDNAFDLIICPLEMPGLDGLELREEALLSPHLRDAAFVMMLGAEDKGQMGRLERQGIKDHLLMPFDSRQLRQTVEKALDMRSRRSQRRYSLPDASATLRGSGWEIKARVINISLGGVFCEIRKPEQCCNVIMPVQMSLAFRNGRGLERAEGLGAALLRLNVLEWDERNRPSVIRTAWRFVEKPPAAARTLEMVLERAELELRHARDRAGGAVRS